MPTKRITARISSPGLRRSLLRRSRPFRIASPPPFTSQITSLRTICRTVALTILPTWSAYLRSMMSRSLSWMPWMIACLAVWAAMRPNTRGETGVSIVSPISASGLMRRASASEM